MSKAVLDKTQTDKEPHCDECNCDADDCADNCCACSDCNCDEEHHCRDCEHHESEDCNPGCEQSCGCCNHCSDCDCETKDGCGCDCCCGVKDTGPGVFEGLPVNAVASEILAADYALSDVRYKELLGSKDVLVRLATLYSLVLLSLDNKKAKLMLDRIVKETATHFLNYLVLACVGEARYTSKGIREEFDSSKISPLSASIAAVPFEDGNVGRFSMWARGVKLWETFTKREILDACYQLFSLPWGSHNVGGQSWAKCARIGLDYLDGTYTDLMFVDLVVATAHNNGPVLDKYYDNVHRCNDHETYLGTLLDTKREANSVAEIRAVCCVDEMLLEEAVSG